MPFSMIDTATSRELTRCMFHKQWRPKEGDNLHHLPLKRPQIRALQLHVHRLALRWHVPICQMREANGP
jgi:hypothetical protein